MFFDLKFSQCGVRRTRQIDGVTVSATVIISFHKIFLTKVDRAYRIRCFYIEAEKKVTQGLEVSMLTTGQANAQTEMPQCRYEILRGDLNGPPIKYAVVGEPVYHKWTCAGRDQNLYCMLVHSCTVHDGQGGTKVQVLGAKGCQVDRHILQNLDYLNGMMAGQEAHVFKFADRPALYFNCQIKLKLKHDLKGCSTIQPNCDRRPASSSIRSYTPGGSPSISPYARIVQRHEKYDSTHKNKPFILNRSFTTNNTDNLQDFYWFRSRIRRSDQAETIDFDLPEQQLVVLGLEEAESSDKRREMSQETSKFQHGPEANFESTNLQEPTFCFSKAKLVVLLFFLSSLTVLIIATFYGLFTRRTLLFESYHIQK